MNNKITLASSLFFLIAIPFSGFSQLYNIYEDGNGSNIAYEDGTSVSNKEFSTSSGHTGLTFEFTQSPAGRLSLPDFVVQASNSPSNMSVPIIALDNYIDDGDRDVTVTVTVVGESDANYLGQSFTFTVNVYDNDSHGFTFTDLNNIGYAEIGENIVDSDNDGFDDETSTNVGVVLTTTPDSLDPLYLKITDNDGIFQMVPFLFNSPGGSADAPGSGIIRNTGGGGTPVKALVRSDADLVEVFEQKNVTLVNENGTIDDNVYIALSTKPTDNVTLAISVNDNEELSVSTTSLSFTPSNWYVPQILTVTGVSDTEKDGSVISQINITSSSSDTQYNSYNYTYTNVTTECLSFPCVEFTSSQYQTIQVSENPSIVDGSLNTEPDPRDDDFKHLIGTLHNVIYYNKNRKIIYDSNVNSSSSPYPAYLTAVNTSHYNNFDYELVTNEPALREITLHGVSSFGYWTEKQNYEDNNPIYTYKIKVFYTDSDDSENNTDSTSYDSTITLTDETSEYDYDGDGIPYDLDQCPDTPSSNPNYQSSSLITDTSSPDCGCADSDGDDIFDSYELSPSKYSNATQSLPTNPYDPDSDDDGLTDGEEINTHDTDPNDSDSDDDTFSDGDEVSVNTNPNDPNDSPANTAPNAPTNLYIGFSSNFSAYIISGSVGVGATSVTITFPDNTTQNVTPTDNHFSYTSSTDFSSGNYLFIASNISGASSASTISYNSACEDSPNLFTPWDGDESIDNGQTSVFASNGFPVGPFSTNATIISCYDYSLFQITTINLPGLGDVDVLAFSSPAVYNSGGNNFKKVLIYDPAFAPPGSGQAGETYLEITVEIKSTAPSAPIVTTANGTIVTGTAEAGSTVTVYASDGTTVLGTAIAEGSGNYTVTMSPAQSYGASISVTATDTSGNVSSPTSTSIGFDSIVSIWNGDVSGDWSDIGNWSNGVPSTNYYVEIPTGLSNYPTASSAVVVNTMTLASGSSFIAQSTFTGAVTYNRTLSSNNWYLVSSPVVGETLEGLISNHTFATGSGSNIGIAPYANDGSAWDYQTTEASGSLASGSGYSVKLAAAGAVSFNGTFPTSDVSIGITEDANGLNLIGNPYPSYIAANLNADAVNNVLTINSTILSEETLWFWNSGSSSYVTYNQASSSKFVSPAQGFFVNSNGNNNIQFTEAMQSHQSDSFQRSTATRPEINLMLSNDTNTRSTDIFFIEGTTTGWDNGYDSSIFGGTANSFAIYTHLVSDSEGQDLAIQSLPETNFENWIIPVGINSVAGAAITIVAASQNLPEGIDMYLEDKVEGSFTRLATGESYTTTLSEALNGIGRYYLHTSAQVLGTDDLMHANISIYTISENSIRIVGVQSGSVKVRVYSVLGKQMHATSFQGNGMNDVDLPKVAKGVYLIRLETEIGVLNKKIFIE